MRLRVQGVAALTLPAILLLPVTAGQLHAQSTAGQVSGFVRDTTGAAVPGVTVSVEFGEIAFSRDTVTVENGYYVLNQLPIGPARLTVRLDGFKTFVREGLVLELGARVRVDATLAVGPIAETVQVIAESPALSTTGDVSHLVSGEQTRELAIDGRSYMQLVSILPGVTRNEQSYEFGTSPRADGQQINGLRKNFNGLTLDGAENLDAGSNATQVNNVSIDAIDEFKVMSSQYSAEYGKAGGPQINVVTKRGTKTLHGGAYGFFRDDSLDARNFLTGEKDALRFKNFGWNLGGPIPLGGWNVERDRLHFFVSQEWKDLESQVGLARLVTVPSLAERQGDFSQSPRLPNDPLTGMPFPGGVIPASRMSANGASLAGRFPLPDAGSRDRATLLPTQARDIRQDLIRVDMRSGRSANLSLRFINDSLAQLEPYGSFGGTSGFDLVPTSHDRASQSFVVTFTHNLGSRTLHELTASAVKNNQLLLQTGAAYLRTGITTPELFPLNRGGRAPNITSLTGYSMGTGLFGNDYPTNIVGNYYTLKSNWTFARSRHTFKAGVYLGHFRKGEELRRPDAGGLTFNSSRPNGSGVALADLLLGLYERYTESDVSPYANLRYDQVELYVQDHFQVRPDLTLDLGVRYQYMPAVHDRDDRIATFDPALYDPARAPLISPSGNLVPGTGVADNGIALAGRNGVPRGLYANDTDNVAPRVGFTWRPRNGEKTVIRGGFGVYFDRPVFNATRDQAGSPPLVQTVQLSNGSLDSLGGSASTAPPGGFEAIARDFAAPTVYSYSIGFQRELPWGMLADVNYVGNQARDLLRVRELNFVTPNPATGVAPAPINANRPYRGYGRITTNETTGESDYDSLQVALNRRKGDLNLGVAYTLSRARGDSDSEDSTSSASLAQDPRDPGGEYFYQDFDRRHVLSVNYIYRLPFYRGRRDLTGQALGGWEISGITRWYTGRRYSVTAGTNSAIFGDTVTLRANLVPGQDPNAAPPGGRTVEHWFNTAAFARPATNQLGDSPRNVLEGPGFFSTDLALFKRFPLSSRVRLQLRAEAFNVFNRKNYRAINTSLTATDFGRVTAYEAQRVMQLGLKLNF